MCVCVLREGGKVTKRCFVLMSTEEYRRNYESREREEGGKAV